LICAKKNAIRPMAGPGGGLMAFAAGVRRARGETERGEGGQATTRPGAEVKIQK